MWSSWTTMKSHQVGNRRPHGCGSAEGGGDLEAALLECLGALAMMNASAVLCVALLLQQRLSSCPASI